MITFGIVQDFPAITLEDTLKKIEYWCGQAFTNHCQALCFPEAFLTGYSPEQADSFSLSADHQIFSSLRELASTYQMDLLLGFMEKEENSHYLSHCIIRPDGTKDIYRKTHLGEKEKQYFKEGDSLSVFSLSCGTRIGFQLCVECHFPEITQTLSLRGAEVIFAPHAHPAHSSKRKKIWQKYIPARSYDNRVYMACANLLDGNRFFGGLYVTDPDGDVTAEYFEKTASLLTFSVDTNRLKKYRAMQTEKRFRYYPGQRRTSLYD